MRKAWARIAASALTIKSNDEPFDLTGAKDLVIQHLRDLKYIN